MDPAELQSLVSAVQEQLRRENYMAHTSLQRAFLSYDRDRSGFVDLDEVKRICGKYNLPLQEELLQEIVRRCDIDGNGKIDYNEFISFLVRA